MNASTTTRMTIGEAATVSGMAADNIRYYEKIGLLAKPARTATGNYRTYGGDDVRRLSFIRRARELGFPVEGAGNAGADGPSRSRLRPG